MYILIYLLLSIETNVLNVSQSIFETFLKSEPYQKLFKYKKHRELIFNLMEEKDQYKNSDKFNFFVGYKLYKYKEYELSRKFLNKVKDKNLKYFSKYFSGMGAFYKGKTLIAEKYFSEIDGKHYFLPYLKYHQALIDIRRGDLKNLEEIINNDFSKFSKKYKKKILEKYLNLVLRKGGKKRIKKVLHKYLKFSPFGDKNYKKYIDKYLSSEQDKYLIATYRYDYYLKKFKYYQGLKDVENLIKKYHKLIPKTKSLKLRRKYLYHQNILYLYKIKFLYRKRQYYKTTSIFKYLFKQKRVKKDPQFILWYSKVLYKRNMVKRLTQLYKKYRSIFRKTDIIEEFDYLLGDIYYRNGKFDQAEGYFSKFLLNYPNSDKKDEIVEKMGWSYYRLKKLSKALDYYKILKKSDKFSKRLLGYYWHGKILLISGFKDEGIKDWRYILENYPLNYYSNLILNQAHLYSFVKTFILTNKKVLTKDIDIDFKNHLKDPNIPNYIKILLELKFYKLAKYEIFYLYKKWKREIPDGLKMAIAKIYMLEENERYAHWILYHAIREPKYPEDNFKLFWKIAYPKPFEDEVNQASTKFGISKHLIYAVIRQESAFNEKAKSYANAFGLMQLLYPTARRMRKEAKVKIYRYWHLFNPKTNIFLGTRYLEYLMDYFNNNIIYSIASYNAGERRIKRWDKRFGNLPIDEFVENIPINQTKEYVKKVFTAMFSYYYLYDKIETKNYIDIFSKVKK